VSGRRVLLGRLDSWDGGWERRVRRRVRRSVLLVMASGHPKTEIFHDEQDRRLFSHAFRMQGEDEKVDSRLGANILGGVKWPQSIATRRDRAGDAILWRALICDTVRGSFEGGLSPIFVTRLNLLGQFESSQVLLGMVCNQLSKR